MVAGPRRSPAAQGGATVCNLCAQAHVGGADGRRRGFPRARDATDSAEGSMRARTRAHVRAHVSRERLAHVRAHVTDAGARGRRAQRPRRRTW